MPSRLDPLRHAASPVAIAITVVAVAEVVAEGESYPDGELVWADEFEVDGPPDPTQWGYEHGFVRNREAQWYQPENAVCRDGLLVIEGRRERVANPDYDPTSDDWRRNRRTAEYTSACVKTFGKFAWRYGLMEVRARIDAREGLWPAIWTLGRGSWPRCGEVDLMEFYAGDLLANACWLPAPGETSTRAGVVWDESRRPLADVGPAGWSDGFHVWRMTWDERRIRLSVDGLLLNEIDTTAAARPEDAPHPFRHPHYILLNLAIGGHAGGDPSRTEFPATFEVDYVRVYAPADETATPGE